MKILRKLTAEIESYLYNLIEIYGDNINEYKDSPYVHTCIYKNKKYIYNILTDEILELKIDENVSDNYAIRKWYKLYKDLDPYTIATLAVKLNLAKVGKDLYPIPNVNFTIFTTTCCNARCFYCFESGRCYKSMTEETALDIAKYLKSQFCGIPLEICWFGGEPILNLKVVSIITEYLSNNLIPFYSSFITNGSKIKYIDLYTLLYKWNTTNILITLDGIGGKNDLVKQFVDNSTFQDIKDGLDILSATNIEVGLRMNIGPDEQDFENKKELAQWMVDNYGKFSNFSISTSFIYDTDSMKFTEEQRTKALENNHKIHEILKKSPIFKFNSFQPPINRDLYSCIAHSRKGITIDVDGNFLICQAYSEEKSKIGDIYNGFSSLSSLQSMGVQKKLDKCKYCKYYPSCKYLLVCEAAGNCDTLNIDKLDLGTDEFVANYIDTEIKE